ncbi:phosphoribosyltransferase [Mycobacterium sp. AT1]|uniref:phosphoribosyltransferase n=1 Tax=Mycobacterium sp. AT1 TaxID=1961706 RepID=UPI001150864B|nr:phosphoribosyltransferase [Mycobacterium sp. AT1]
MTVSLAALYGDPGRTLQDVAVLAPAPHGVEPILPCMLCSQGTSTVIPISAASLHIEVTGAVSRHRLTKTLASTSSAFVKKYAGTGTILAHQQEIDGHRRHHAVSIDARGMFKSKDFRAALSSKLHDLSESIDVIICPEHRAAEMMAEFARSQLGIDPIRCDENRFHTLSDSDRERIRESKSLLILDDVVISGDRLRGYRQYLFELGRETGDVHALVAVSRPTSSDDAQAIRNLVDQMTTDERSFHAIEEVILPNWDETECPWCLEHEALSKYAGMGDDGEYSNDFVQRYEILDAPHEGLIENLFWSADDTALPLGANSIFAPAEATEAELFFSVASTFQEMRSLGQLDEDYRPPVSKILTPEFWIRGRFYAPAITAAILRAARPHDLLPPRPSQKMKSNIAARLNEHGSHGIKFEILLAIARQKLPIPDALEEILEIDDDADEIGIDFFRSMIFGTSF